MKVLWLASSYPSAIHPFEGDFIQRHARATALFCDIEVIHVVKDEEGIITIADREIVSNNKKVTERIIYYKPVKTSIKIIDRLLSSLRYKKLYRKAVNKYLTENDKPAFIHVHMAMKAGLVALWLKRKHKIPYILSEHWGGYLAEAKPNISDYNFVYRQYWNKIITEAMLCTFVSLAFKKQMINKYKIKNSVVIPNVVDTDIFYPAQKKLNNTVKFIHVSTMIYQKNTEAIIAALALIKNEANVKLELYGPGNGELENMINELGLQKHVFMKGEVAQDILSSAMQQSDALILYSRFETFGCVLIEANACGIPVIVSDLEVFHELVEEGINGLFVEGENPAALAEKMKQFISSKNNFDNTAIAKNAAQKYNYSKIGGQFNDLYNNIATILE